jgi:transcriptional regulator with XRE-family HTH domain
MHTLDYLVAVKKRLGIESDYALASRLGITRSAISKIQQGKGVFGDDVALSVAQILEIEPIIVIAQANAERASTPEGRERWMGLIAGFLALLSPAKRNGPERRRIARIAPYSVTTA